MSKKHFEAVAASIAKQVREYDYMLNDVTTRTNYLGVNDERYTFWLDRKDVLRRTVSELCTTFRGFNANFDAAKFTAACGL